MRPYFYLLLLLTSFPALCLERIALGSCNKHYEPQNHWEVIAGENPDIWLWLGDNIYADHFSYEERKTAYDQLLAGDYGTYIGGQIPVIGTWDDHDYAYDNAGAEYADKAQSKQLFLSFLGYGPYHPVFGREGIYHAYSYNEQGRQVLFLNLDLRYFMDTSKSVLLGEAQWAWLENQLANANADIIFISSSLNVLNTFTLGANEGWFRFKREKKRLFSLISPVSAPVILLSGDRHTSDVAKKTLSNDKVLYEMMASGMTHNNFGSPNKYRISNIVFRKNFGFIELDWDDGLLTGISLQIKSTKNARKLARIDLRLSHGKYSEEIGYRHRP